RVRGRARITRVRGRLRPAGRDGHHGRRRGDAARGGPGCGAARRPRSFSPWLTTVDQLAGGIGLALLAAAAVIERWRGERLRNTARFAMMFTGSALYLKLLVLLHPDKWLIDAVFHAHRLENVMAGNYFFTSIAPGGYTFPYPIALYVTALPLARLVTDHVLLLRLVTAAAEAASALFFYWMIVRGSGDRLAAAVA